MPRPLAHYANPNAIAGRAGLFPSRYQSDKVDLHGHLVRCGNRRLGAALLPPETGDTPACSASRPD